MTSLKKLHAFCTMLDHYPSRLAIQQEIERLLAEEAQLPADTCLQQVAKKARAFLDTLYGKEARP